ncbi:MAG: tetratricopeptide repeat protein [Planctomycetota bacterium]
MSHLKKRNRRRARAARNAHAPEPAFSRELQQAVDEAMRAAVQSHVSGDLDRAAQLYAQILAAAPHDAEAWHLAGVLAHQRGDHHTAIDLIGHAIEVHHKTARRDNAEHLLNLGSALAAVGKTNDAVTAFRRSIELQPTCTAWNNLGNARKSLGHVDAALKAFELATAMDPTDPRPLANQGATLLEQGELQEAARALRSALAMAPDLLEAENNLALVQTRLGNFEDAVAGFITVLQRAPKLSAGWRNLRNCLNDVGQVQSGISAYSKLIPESKPILRDVLPVSICPVINESQASIDEFRSQLSEVTHRHVGAKLLERHAELLTHQVLVPFYLPYQGRDDRRLKQAYARMIESDRCAPLHTRSARPARGKLRVGFPVAMDRHRIFLRFMRGLLEYLVTCDEFQIVVACLPENLHAMRSALSERIELVTMSGDLRESAQAVAQSACDVLYHYEVGTDTLNYFLPYFSAAPIQATSWGIPVTSGISEMDYFLSSELTEPLGAEAHYSESLIRTKTLPVIYDRPVPPPQIMNRESFGFAECERIYGCVQSPFKNHPDFDELVAGILRNDDRARVVFVGGAHETSNRLLRRRMERSIGDVISRVQFMPRLNRGTFADLMRCCDVLLDTIHFGGGATTFEALALGIPVITLPGQFMRGRVTSGCYQRLGLDDCVALDPQDYVRRAIALAQDTDRNRDVRIKISERVDDLFEDQQAGAEFRDFLHSIITDGPREAA